MLDARFPNARSNNMCVAVGGGRRGRGVFSDAAQLEWVPPGVTPDLVSAPVPLLGSDPDCVPVRVTRMLRDLIPVANC